MFWPFKQKLSASERSICSSLALLGQSSDINFSKFGDIAFCDKREHKGTVIHFEKQKVSIASGESSGYLGYGLIRQEKGYPVIIDVLLTDGTVDLLLVQQEASELSKILPESIEFIDLHLWDLNPSLVNEDNSVAWPGDVYLDQERVELVLTYFARRASEPLNSEFAGFLASCHRLENPSYSFELLTMSYWFWHPFRKSLPHSILFLGMSDDGDVGIGICGQFRNRLLFYVFNQDLREIFLETENFQEAMDRFVKESIASVEESKEEG